MHGCAGSSGGPQDVLAVADGPCVSVLFQFKLVSLAASTTYSPVSLPAAICIFFCRRPIVVAACLPVDAFSPFHLMQPGHRAALLRFAARFSFLESLKRGDSRPPEHIPSVRSAGRQWVRPL